MSPYFPPIAAVRTPVWRPSSEPLAYQVWQTVSERGARPTSHVLTYRTQVTTLAPQPEGWTLEILKGDLQLDHTTVHGAFDDLLLITAQALQRVECRVDKRGNLRAITNLPEITQRWQRAREQVLACYQGETVNDYLDAMAQPLADEHQLLTALRRDFFYTAYFNNLYADFGMRRYRADSVRLFDLLPPQVLDCPVELTLVRPPVQPVATELAPPDGTPPDRLQLQGHRRVKAPFERLVSDWLTDLLGKQTHPAWLDVEVEGEYQLDAPTGSIQQATLRADLSVQLATRHELYGKSFSIEITAE